MMDEGKLDETPAFIFRKHILRLNNYYNHDNILLGSRPKFVHKFFDYFKINTILDYDDIILFDNTENILAYVDKKNNIFFVERELLKPLIETTLNLIDGRYIDNNIIRKSLGYLEKSTLCLALGYEYIDGVVIKLKCTDDNIFILTDNGNLYTIWIRNKYTIDDSTTPIEQTTLKPKFKLSLLDMDDFEICSDLSIIYKQIIVNNTNNDIKLDIKPDINIDIKVKRRHNGGNYHNNELVYYDCNDNNNTTTYNYDVHDIYNGNNFYYSKYNMDNLGYDYVDDDDVDDDDDNDSDTCIMHTRVPNTCDLPNSTQTSNNIYRYKIKEKDGIISTIFESKFDMKFFASKSFTFQKIVVFACENSLNNFYLPEHSRTIFPGNETIILANGCIILKVISTYYKLTECKKVVSSLVILSNGTNVTKLTFSYEHFQKIKEESKFNYIYMYNNNKTTFNKKGIFYVCKSHSDSTLKFYSILNDGGCEAFGYKYGDDANYYDRDEYPSFKCLTNSKIIENQIDLSNKQMSIKYLLISPNLTKWLINYILCIFKKFKYYIPLLCMDMILNFIDKKYFSNMNIYYNKVDNNQISKKLGEEKSYSLKENNKRQKNNK